MAFLRKGLIGLCVALAIASFGAELYLDWFYSRNMPREPRPEEGRTVRTRVNKGTYVYLTEVESMAPSLLASGSIIFIVAGFALAIYWGYIPYRIRGEPDWIPQLSLRKRKKRNPE